MSIISNQYQVRFSPSIGIHKYQVQHSNGESIEAANILEVLKANRQVIQEKLKKFLHLGNIIYSPTKVDLIEIPENCIRLTYMNSLGVEEKEYQNLLSRFFKQVIRQQREMVSVGNKAQKLFAPGRSVVHQDKKLEIWPGVECVLQHHFENKLSTLTIDCAFKVLRDKTALQELNDLRNNKQPFDKMNGEIVMTVYNRKFYRIERVNLQMSAKSKFSNDKGEQTSFAEYYKKRYNLDIKALDAPLLEAVVREREKGAQEPISRTIQLIPELCKMTGLTEEIRNNFQAMKAIATTTKPNGQTRVNEASNFVKQLRANVKTKDGSVRPSIFTEWGVEINPQPLAFPDKSLPPGALLMAGSKPVDIRTANLDRETQQPMFKNGNMARWAVFYGQRDEGPCQTFLQEITKVNNDFKFGLQAPVVKTIQDTRAMDQWFKAIQEVIGMAGGPQNVNFFLFILPGPKKKAPLYTAIKQVCIKQYPVPSQVILFDTIKNGKGLRSICNKLCVQIVSKTGGVPWAISDIPPSFSRIPTMIIGYDIFHKKNEQKPSQLAFCSTIDPQFGRYYSQNIPSGEFSTNLEALCTGAIQAFECANKIKPQNIVIFRDGASEGQEDVIKAVEVAQFQKAVEASGYATKIIFILTNKRVSAKFYTNQMENPAPGCVIDSKITKGYDFYLIAQKTTQGTVTPTHYKILHNDLSDVQGIVQQIQSLAFKLCFLYYNWTGSIKVPSPVRYAHCFCNFIGDRYLASDVNQFLPAEDLMKRNSLFYI